MYVNKFADFLVDGGGQADYDEAVILDNTPEIQFDLREFRPYKQEDAMNKLTPHLIRDLDATLPAGTECYLNQSARQALSKYRKGKHSATFLSKSTAVQLLAEKLGRGLKRFLADDVRRLLPDSEIDLTRKMA
jgi:hypothetical protein